MTSQRVLYPSFKRNIKRNRNKNNGTSCLVLVLLTVPNFNEEWSRSRVTKRTSQGGAESHKKKKKTPGLTLSTLLTSHLFEVQKRLFEVSTIPILTYLRTDWGSGQEIVEVHVTTSLSNVLFGSNIKNSHKNYWMISLSRVPYERKVWGTHIINR